MFSNINIVYTSQRVSKSLAPANKRKTHRTIVVVPQQRFLRIPPDNQDVNHVRIIHPPPSYDARQPPTPPKLTKSLYPYGTSLIRRYARDVKQRKRLIVFNTTSPAAEDSHASSGSGKKMDQDVIDDFLADTFQRDASVANNSSNDDMYIDDLSLSLSPSSSPEPSPSTSTASSETTSIPTIDLMNHRVLLETDRETTDLNATPYLLPNDYRFAPSCVIKYRYIFEELSRVSRVYDSTAIQLQVSAACGNAFQNLKTTLLKLHNITVLSGSQIITQTVPHTPQAVAAFKYCHNSSDNVLDTVRSVIPRAVSYHETGVHQLYVSGATKKDLINAATLCAAVAEKQPDIFNINICALSYPSIAAPHLPLYNYFTEFQPQACDGWQ
ncbi:Rh150 [macacine betaherpesvirus 3]|nr:Rh150 [macacine betaherpesvirus 3]APT40370.1 Rh150 [macacine betaherpesvirus 3]QQL11335.1 Rh150 [macacine betaherpesvirus 3]